MFRRIGTALVCLAMFSIAGGHWAVLQSVAWAGMLSDYARNDGFVVAAKKTFGGQYPCDMCRRIAEKRQTEQGETPLVKVEKKAEPIFSQHTATALFPPAPDHLLPIPPARSPDAVIFDPPQPVPRLA